MSSVLAEPYHTELIDGREVDKPLPKKLDARIQAYLIRALGNNLPETFEVLSELNVLAGGDRVVPDIIVASRTARYEEGDLVDAPILAIEILSPGQTVSRLFDRAERLLNSGTSLCWIILPERRQAWTYAATGLHESADTLRFSLPEGVIEVDLVRMFHILD